MLTKWAKNMLMSMVMQTGTSRYNVPVKPFDESGTIYYTAGYSIKDDTGRWPVYKNLPSAVGVPTSASYTAICIGSGTTAATDADYALESPITSGWSASISGVLMEDSSDNPVMKYAITVTNSSSSDITIGEIGFYGKCVAIPTLGGSGGMVGAKTNARILIDRTVLDTPITLAAGASTIIDYEFTATVA